MTEPPRQTGLDTLWQPFADKVLGVLAALKADGFDPIVYEALRSQERQTWLYGVGRTHDLGRKPVTWVRHSKHQDGRAADIISKAHGWSSDEFFDALAAQARHWGLRDYRGGISWDGDRAHIQAQ